MEYPKHLHRVQFIFEKYEWQRLAPPNDLVSRGSTRLYNVPEVAWVEYNVFVSLVILCIPPIDGDLEGLERRLLDAIRGFPRKEVV